MNDDDWSRDSYWADALREYETLRKSGRRLLCIDLEAIEGILYEGDGPAYRLLNGMDAVMRTEGRDGYRGAPRLVQALLVHLHHISEASQEEKAP